MHPRPDARDFVGDYSEGRNMVYLRFSLDSGACSGYTEPASSRGVFLRGGKCCTPSPHHPSHDFALIE